MSDKKSNLALFLAKSLKERNNPLSYNECSIGIVQKAEPLLVALTDGQIQLSENLGNLYIPEWFKFRCDIDKTSVLSSDVSDRLQSAQNVTETHSYGGAPCSMPNAVIFLAEAISGIRDELLKLKCIIAPGDKVIVCPLEADSHYILIDKV